MLVALHGNGDTPENFYATAMDELNVPARIILFKGPMPYGRGSAWPWSASDFGQYGNALIEATEMLAVKYPTTGKPVLLGFSGGGAMAYYQAIIHGNKYSHIFPVSGQLSRQQLGSEVSDPGAQVTAYHGTSDTVVSSGGGKAAVKLLKAEGVSARLTEFKGGHHGVFTNMKRRITQAVEEQLLSLQ